MGVTINIPPFLLNITNETKIAVAEVSTIGECLQEFVKRFPNTTKLLFDDDGKLHGYIEVYLNGVNIDPENLSKAVADGDELDLTFVIAGG